MERNYHKEFKNRKIKKPNQFIAKIVQLAFKNISKKRNAEFVYTDEFLKLKDSQVIYLCQHKSALDYIYFFSGVKNLNVNILCGYQNVFQRKVFGLLKSLGVIAKMLYQPDLQATAQMLQAVKNGSSLAIFPEGIQSTSGSTHPINPATKNFIKKGKITVTFDRLFSSEDCKNLSQEQLHNALLERFKYNEFDEFEGKKVAFHGKKPDIYGLDNVIFKCPHCNNEYAFTTHNDQMTCNCGFAIKMDDYYNISSINKTLPFKNIDEWYKWQRSRIANEILDDNYSISTKVTIGNINVKKLDNNYSLQYHGEGVLTLNNKGLTYDGYFDGENVSMFFEPKQVYSLTMSLKYDLDLYYKGTYFNFKLLENQKQVAKWMIMAEEIHNLYDEKWKEVSDEVYDYE